MNAQDLIAFAKSVSVLDLDRLENLCNLMSLVQQNRIEGDIVECGVFKGGSAALLAGRIVDQPERKLWLYDTFDKFPPPVQPVDGPGAVYGGIEVGRIEEIQPLLVRVGLPADRVTFRKGLFSDTFQQPLPDKIALLHLDCDWYESVYQCLHTLYCRVSEGGYVILDDFGYFEGCRVAFYNFCRDMDIKPLLERCGYTEAWWKKGATNSRNLEVR